MTEPTQIYGTFGGTPSEKPSQTSGARPFGVSANPNTFGAQVAEARQQEGAVHREIGAQSMDFAMKHQGMINQTIANERAEQFTLGIGELTEKLRSKSGNDAAAYMPEYIESITKLRGDLMTGIPKQAAMALDSVTRVGEAQAIVGGHSYAGEQTRSAYDKSLLNGMASYVSQAALQQNAESDAAMGFLTGNMTALANQKYLDAPGTELNPQTGMVEFLKTPEGDAAKDSLKRELDQHIGNAQLNRFSTLTEIHGVEKAYAIYNEAKENIPEAAQAQLEAYFVPRVNDAQARGVVGTVMDNAMRSYYDSVSSPAAVKQYNTKLSLGRAVHGIESDFGRSPMMSYQVKGGNVAVGDMQITPDTWQTWKNLGIVKAGEELTNEEDNINAGYRALQYYADQYGDPQRALVAYFSGPGNVAPAGSPTPWIEDRSDGNKLVSEYVSDGISRMGGMDEAGEVAGVGGQKAPPIMPTPADHFMNHYTDYLRLAAEYAESVKPGDVAFAAKARTYYEQQMNDIKQEQAAQDYVARSTAFKALSGDFTKGRKPVTEEQMAVSPQVRQNLDAWRARDPDGYRKVVTETLEENAMGDVKHSPNFYGVARKIIGEDGDKVTESDLYTLLSRKHGTGINMKDYNALLRMIDDRAKRPDWTEKFLQPMVDEIEKYGGNVDGLGESRASQFLNVIERARREKEKSGVTTEEMMDDAFFGNKDYLGDLAEPFKPSREQQLEFMSKNIIIPAVLNRGDIVMGYEYIGGDQTSASSWRKAL